MLQHYPKDYLQYRDALEDDALVQVPAVVRSIKAYPTSRGAGLRAEVEVLQTQPPPGGRWEPLCETSERLSCLTPASAWILYASPACNLLI